MTGEYFQERLNRYEREALAQMSRDMINAYESEPKLLTELLVRFAFFERIETEEERVMHNKAKEILYDMGIFREGRELDMVQSMLAFAEIPYIYKQEDDL